jgi:putative DNA primase/helicase
LGEIEVASAPEWLIDLISAPKSTDAIDTEPTAHQVPAAKLDRARAYAEAACRRELDRLRKAPHHQRNDTLNKTAFKLGQLAPYGILSTREVTDDLARVAREIGLDESEIQPTIMSGLKGGGHHPRRLPFLRSHDRVKTVEPPKRSDDDLAADLARLGETDTDNAERFARRFGAKAMHTPGRGWLVYDGKRWRPDDLFQVNELAKKTARLIADEAQHLDGDSARVARSKFATQSLAKGSLDRMLDLAKSLLAVEDDRLDADPWLFNVVNGTIDLRTGRREKHDPRDLLTKIAPVRANRRAKCPLFKKFLKRITGDDAALRVFIQKAVGYSLTGVTTEQVFFFVYGKSGNNGKSTLVNLIRDMLGDYGWHTPIETLLTKQYDNNIPADLACLAGARMVTAIEANFNRHLDEAKIKAMTGGEPITARFMRQNFFSFQPEFKLWFVANDRPRVRGTDDAFWRRVCVILLNIKIPSSERDRDLPNKLRVEWPGILAWAIRGCRKWQREGLAQPATVRSATKGWQKEMDHLKKFVAEELIIAPGLKILSSQMYDRYKKWCSSHGEEALTVQNFKAKLQESLDVTHMPPMPCSCGPPRSTSPCPIFRQASVGVRTKPPARVPVTAPRYVGAPVLGDRPRRAPAQPGQTPSRAARRGPHAKRRTARRSDGGADRRIWSLRYVRRDRDTERSASAALIAIPPAGDAAKLASAPSAAVMPLDFNGLARTIPAAPSRYRPPDRPRRQRPSANYQPRSRCRH